MEKASFLFQGLAVGPLLSPRFSNDLRRAFGKLWELIEAFRLRGDALIIVGNHPALHWEIRVRKREILEYFKDHGIKDIRIQGAIR